MFNNPFDSFHNTVVEAKEEREQLDRLLTISTPRERQLVAGIAILMLILAAWLLFGSVARSLAVDGVLVEPGVGVLEDTRTMQALVWTRGDVTAHIQAGMPVVIELHGVEGDADALHGTIASLTALSLFGGLAMVESAAPVSAHRIDILLDERLALASLAGRECRIVIELGRQSPLARLRTRRP